MSSSNSAAFTLAANRRRRGTGQSLPSPISLPPSPAEGGARRSPRLAGAAVAAAAALLGAAPLLPSKGKAFFSSDAVVLRFAPAQGLPLVSFHPSSSVYAPYTSAAAVALQPPFLEPLCATVDGIVATDSVAWVQFMQLAMAPPPPRVLDFSQHLSIHSSCCLLCLSHQHQRSAHLHMCPPR